MARPEKVVRRMLTTEEAAAYLRTTVRHVRRLVTDHELSRYKVGGRNRFADVDLDAWLESRRVEGTRRRLWRPPSKPGLSSRLSQGRDSLDR
jgi:excisionase family DNA binding protein